MPGKMVECSSCTNIMRSDNLKRHKNFCKVARRGGGILFTPASSGIVPKRKVMQLNEHLDESESSSSEDEESLADIVVDESDDEGMVSTIATITLLMKKNVNSIMCA